MANPERKQQEEVQERTQQEKVVIRMPRLGFITQFKPIYQIIETIVNKGCSFSKLEEVDKGDQDNFTYCLIGSIGISEIIRQILGEAFTSEEARGEISVETELVETENP